MPLPYPLFIFVPEKAKSLVYTIVTNRKLQLNIFFWQITQKKLKNIENLFKQTNNIINNKMFFKFVSKCGKDDTEKLHIVLSIKRQIKLVNF